MFKRFTYQRILLLLFLYTPFSCAMDWESSKNEFFAAARDGNIQKIRDLKSFVNARDLGDNTALVIAVKNKKIEAAKELIELGIDIDRKNNNGQTALTVAIEAKDLEMVKILLDAGADISKKYVGNKTPLILAIETNDLKIIEEILNEVPDPRDVLIEARFFVKEDKIRNLLGAENADKILELLVKAENQYELYEKIKEKKSNSDISDIKTFLATHPIISLNVKSIERNPLIAAITDANNLELVKFLVGEGANVNQKVLRFTPLMAAILGVEKPNIEIIAFLLEKGADPNIEFIKGGESFTPLMLGVMEIVAGKGTPGLIKLLVKHGAKIDVGVSLEGENIPLIIFAALGNNVELVKELLEAGANPLLQNSEGQTARDIVIIELGQVAKKLEKAISENNKKKKKKYEEEKQNYENIIKLLETKEKEIAGKKVPTTIADQKALLTSLQSLTQSLRALQRKLVVK